jgi:hypothetical protein
MFVADICSTIVDAVTGSALMRRHTSTPLRSGRLMSRITSGGRSSRVICSASFPVEASSTLNPARCRMRVVA